MKSASNHFGVLIIGGGPIGLACALEAAKAKLDYVVLEKGCLVNSLYHYPANMTFFSTSERLEIGKVPFVSNNPKPTRAEALEYYRRVAVSHGLNIRLFEEVTSIKKKRNGLFGNILQGKIPCRKYHNRHRVLRYSIQAECSRRRPGQGYPLL